MTRHRTARLLAVATLAVATSATAAPARTATPWLSYDAALAAVSAPGFAGVWIENDALVVALTHPNAAAARSARADASRLLRRPDLRGKRIEIRRAQYSFRTLRRWYDAMRGEVFALPGVVSGDVDEHANVLRFGAVAPGAIRVRVTALASRFGVPSGAVVVEHGAPARPTSLLDPARPVVGGILIGTSDCTLGFPAVRNGVKGFVMASHCTHVQGSTTGDPIWQPDPVVIATHTVYEPIGDETYDPPLSGSCQNNTGRCRRSDSAFVTLRDPANFVAGLIARPASTGTIAWNGVDTYRVTSVSDAIVGDTVWRVGITSGLTSVSVIQTCVDRSQILGVPGVGVDTGVLMECQTSTGSPAAQGGDSGEPDFLITSGNDVSLVGINWGQGDFSPISNVQETAELGPLSLCATGFSC